MRGCFALGARETYMVHLTKHVEEMCVRQRGMEDGGEQKGWTSAESMQAWPTRKAEGAHRDRSGQGGPMAGGDKLGAGCI